MLSIEQRKIVYQGVLDLLNKGVRQRRFEEGNFFFVCVWLNRVCYYRYRKTLGSDTTEANFPEFYAQKPANLIDPFAMGAWWPSGPKGLEARKNALMRAIELCN